MTTGISAAPIGITVNTVVPGVFDTEAPMEWHMGEGRTYPVQNRGTAKERAAKIPVGRMGDPQEVADLCAYLASPKSAFITGQSIHINGGAMTS